MHEPVFLEHEFAIERDAHLVAVVYAGPHESRFVDKLVEQTLLANAIGKKTAVLIYLTKDAVPPGGEDRKRLSELMDMSAPTSWGTSYVVTGTGFRGAMHRSVLVGLNILSNTKMPTNVASNTKSAIQWLCANGLPASEGESLEKLLEGLIHLVNKKRES